MTYENDNPNALANIAAMAARAKVAMIDLANLIEKNFSVKVEVKENPNLDRSLATFRGACKWRDMKADDVRFGELEFQIDGQKFDLRFRNFAELRCVIENGYRGYRYHEKKDGFNLQEIVKNIETRVANAKASRELSDKQAVMKVHGEKVADEFRPLLDNLPFGNSITVHPSNEAPVFGLHVTLTEEQLRKVTAILATF
jgi:hypothetical protein